MKKPKLLMSTVLTDVGGEKILEINSRKLFGNRD